MLERVVPVHGREAVALQHLRAAVPDLEAGEGRRCEHVLDPQPTPVGVAEERDAAVAGDPRGQRLDVREGLSHLGQLGNAEGERLGLTVGGGGVGCELAGGEDDEPVVVDLGHVPVVGDREDVEARLCVVVTERGRRRLAVGVRRVCVQLAAQPDAVLAEERARHGSGQRVRGGVVALAGPPEGRLEPRPARTHAR